MANDNNHSRAQIEGLATLLVLNQEIRKLNNINEFTFFVTNESYRLIHYKISFLWQINHLGTIEVLGQSGAIEFDKHSYVSELLIKKIQQQLLTGSQEIESFTWNEEDNGRLTKDHFEFPEHVLWCPLLDKHKQINGGLLFFRDTEFTDAEKNMFKWLVASYQYSWTVLLNPSKLHYLKKIKEKPYLIAVTMLVTSFIFLPVRITAIATGIVTPKSPVLINSPLQGVIKSFAVNSGEHVKAGQSLFTIDKTELSADYEINKRDYLLTQTKLRTAINKQLETGSQDADVPILESELEIVKAKLDYTNAVLQKTDIKSPIDGIVIFDDKEDWLGQPIQTGEHILTVANPNLVQVKVYLPVTNLINLHKDSKGSFFAYGQLASIPIKLVSLGYNAKLLPNKILAYEMIADISNGTVPQLGAQGTVKLYGDYVPLIYYILRRPLQLLREQINL